MPGSVPELQSNLQSQSKGISWGSGALLVEGTGGPDPMMLALPAPSRSWQRPIEHPTEGPRGEAQQCLPCPPGSKTRNSPCGLPSTWFLTRSQFRWWPVKRTAQGGQNGKDSNPGTPGSSTDTGTEGTPRPSPSTGHRHPSQRKELESTVGENMFL